MDLETAARTIRQLRDVLATISTYAGEMQPSAISAIAALAVQAADRALDELGAK